MKWDNSPHPSSTFARWRHWTTTTRMHFAAISLLCRFVSRTSDSSQKKKQITEYNSLPQSILVLVVKWRHHADVPLDKTTARGITLDQTQLAESWFPWCSGERTWNPRQGCINGWRTFLFLHEQVVSFAIEPSFEGEQVSTLVIIQPITSGYLVCRIDKTHLLVLHHETRQNIEHENDYKNRYPRSTRVDC